jgi:hypothetical protein
MSNRFTRHVFGFAVDEGLKLGWRPADKQPNKLREAKIEGAGRRFLTLSLSVYR